MWMHTLVRYLFVSGLIAALAACGDDSGSSVLDAGAIADGAVPPTDGGGPGDGGVSDRDGGAEDGGGADRDGAVPRPGPDVDRSDPMLHEHTIDPSDIDPAVRDYVEDQFAQLDTRSEPIGRLVFFLPGANNPPGAWRDHGRWLAGRGFHVVIPHYNNAWGSACSGMGGDCNVNTRWEALTGEDVSGAIEASRADSAEGRVIRMLEHLTTEHPGGDWGYYLDDAGGLRYDHVIIAGISHGATSAGLFAWRRPFFRAVMHSGGFGGEDADPATPRSEHYGLSHTGDEQHAAHLDSWERAGLVGAATDVDGASPPYDGARRLITSEPNTYPHCSVAVHSSSPRIDGAFVFDPVWRTMYGAL
jgi:hypothetical protein